jgi:hypothetical protein
MSARRLFATRAVSRISAAWLVLLAACSQPAASPTNQPAEPWQEDFGIEKRKLSDSGKSRYWILMPGHQLVLGSAETRLIRTVLDETKEINGIRTRVLESREEENGQPVEITRNFFAIDQDTGDVFYFGEEVNMFQRGGTTTQRGSWLAYDGPNKPGLVMPGKPRVGMRYYQELAPGVAMDRAEVVSISETCKTPAGEFKDCMVTRESSAIDPAIEHKGYAPDIGLVQDQSFSLLSHGYVSGSGH